eukprot:2913611-Amphidinium_carterae.1
MVPAEPEPEAEPSSASAGSANGITSNIRVRCSQPFMFLGLSPASLQLRTHNLEAYVVWLSPKHTTGGHSSSGVCAVALTIGLYWITTLLLVGATQ